MTLEEQELSIVAMENRIEDAMIILAHLTDINGRDIRLPDIRPFVDQWMVLKQQVEATLVLANK